MRQKSENEIIIYNDYAEMILYNRKGKEKARTIIDIDKINIVKQCRWFLNSKGYIQTCSIGKIVNLSRFLLNLKEYDGKIADHINGNTLDNRICNLRIVTSHQNSMNKRKIKIILVDFQEYIGIKNIINGVLEWNIKESLYILDTSKILMKLLK
jgi:hypothetical protein